MILRFVTLARVRIFTAAIAILAYTGEATAQVKTNAELYAGVTNVREFELRFIEIAVDALDAIDALPIDKDELSIEFRECIADRTIENYSPELVAAIEQFVKTKTDEDWDRYYEIADRERMPATKRQAVISGCK